MQLSPILFFVFGALTLGAALVVVVRRDLFQASLALAVCCMGVAGLLALLGAPIVAALQLIVCAGGAAALIKLNPLPAETTRSNALGPNRQWWAAALVAAALCGTLGWVAFAHYQDTAPLGEAVSPSIASANLGELALLLAVAATLLAVALVGAVQIVRRR